MQVRKDGGWTLLDGHQMDQLVLRLEERSQVCQGLSELYSKEY